MYAVALSLGCILICLHKYLSYVYVLYLSTESTTDKADNHVCIQNEQDENDYAGTH